MEESVRSEIRRLNGPRAEQALDRYVLEFIQNKDATRIDVLNHLDKFFVDDYAHATLDRKKLTKAVQASIERLRSAGLITWVHQEVMYRAVRK